MPKTKTDLEATPIPRCPHCGGKKSSKTAMGHIRRCDESNCGKSYKCQQWYTTEPLWSKPKEYQATARELAANSNKDEAEPDWSGNCSVCGQSPIMPITGMCGSCSTGEADTAGGDW